MNTNRAAPSLSTVICILVLLSCPVSLGRTVYVDDDAAGDNNGSAWEQAYRDLPSASPASLWRSPNVSIIVSVYSNGCLLWPAFRETLESDTIIVTGRSAGDPRDAALSADIRQIHRRGRAEGY